MKKTYDRAQAERLRPLLEAIAAELDERHSALERLERQLRHQRVEGVDDQATANVVAELATHKREIRLATQELDRLGASVDVGSRSVVRLPGPDGSWETGYRVSAGDGAMIEELAWQP